KSLELDEVLLSGDDQISSARGFGNLVPIIRGVGMMVGIFEHSHQITIKLANHGMKPRRVGKPAHGKNSPPAQNDRSLQPFTSIRLDQAVGAGKGVEYARPRKLFHRGG